MNIYLAYQYGDFGSQCVIGVADDFLKAEKIIKESFKEYHPGERLLLVGSGRYKKSTSSEEYDYWIKETKMNKKIL